jgi:hypothetical protein
MKNGGRLELAGVRAVWSFQRVRCFDKIVGGQGSRIREVDEIERDIAAFARSPNGGVVVTASPEANRHRDLIVTLAARHRLPAVYGYRSFVTDGGLISYGPDI